MLATAPSGDCDGYDHEHAAAARGLGRTAAADAHFLLGSEQGSVGGARSLRLCAMARRGAPPPCACALGGGAGKGAFAPHAKA